MFLVDHNRWYAGASALNGISGWPVHSSWSGAAGRIASELAHWIAPAPQALGRALEKKLQFVVEPLSVPSAVRPVHEPDVLYVRLTAPAGDGRIAVLPEAARAIACALAPSGGRRAARGVLVGADVLLQPRAVGGAGYPEALAQLVGAIGAFVELGVPFVWRTRGGIEGPLPATLASAIVQAVAALGTSGAVVELGVPSLDAGLASALEGHEGASPAQRLRLASALTSRGVLVRGLVDPLVPMLTDQQHGLEALMCAFGEAGVHKVGARYIVLTRERARTLANRLVGMQRALLQGVFADEPWHQADPAHGASSVHKLLPSHLRRAGHHRVLEAGARHGIFVDILDPVEEGEDLTGASSSSADLPAAGRPKRVRVRPQLELFRKSSSR